MLNDSRRFLELMTTIKSFAAVDYADKFLPQVEIREQELGADEFDRLCTLGKMYQTWIDEELNLAHAQYMLGIITSEQYRHISIFGRRPYLEAFHFDQIEEMEFRYTCLKERAIPEGLPLDVRLSRVRLKDWTNKLRKANDSHGE